MLARSVTINLAGRVGSLVLGFIASLLIARWLGPTDRGLLALLLSVSMMAWIAATFGIPMAVLYYASRPGASTQRLLGTTLAVAAVLTLVFVPLAAVFSGQLANAFAHGRGGLLWVLAAAYVPILFLDSTTHNQLLARLQFMRFNALSVAGRFASLVLAVVLVGVAGIGVAGGLLATIAASVVMVVGSLWALRREGRPRFDGGLLKTLLKYGVRVQATNVFQTLNYRLDVLVLQLFRPLAEVGYYVVSQVIAELVLVLAESFQSSVIPLVAGAEGADRDRTTVLAIRHHGLLAAAACVANAGIGTLLIVFGYGSAYKPAVVPMLILLPGIWWLGTGSVVTTDLRGRGRPGTASVVSGVAVVATLTLDVALIPPFGVVGAAVASVIAYTLHGILSLIVLSRVAGIPVRTLVVPDHDDLHAYPTAARLLVARMRGRGTRAP
jgi:O-antigen/teichoic acid export membrane protein